MKVLKRSWKWKQFFQNRALPDFQTVKLATIVGVKCNNNNQRWSRGHKARGQGQGHKKKSEAKAKDSLSEDRHSRGQGQECSRPRPRTKDTSASALQKKKKGLHKNFSGDLQKKKVFTKIFQAISTKKRFPKNFSSAPQNFNIPKNSAVLEPRTGQFSRT